MQTLHYLAVLEVEVEAMGLHPLALPVLALRQLLAGAVLASRPLTALLHMRWGRGS